MIIPIVFAFDNNLAWPASVCIFSLLQNAKEDTVYDIFILHHKDEKMNLSYIYQVINLFPKHNLQLRSVDNTFNQSFEIRGITTPAYYRLLIPKIIHEYDKVIYSDVDVIFRDDLSSIYSTDLGNNYFGGVPSLAHLDSDMNQYYLKLGLNPKEIIYSGNLLFNSKAIRENKVVTENFIHLAEKDFKFQDMDIINLSCKDRIFYLPPCFCLSTYISQFISHDKNKLKEMWTDTEIENATTNGIVHYNGQKPWKGWCINFDIWWEYYRKSPVFDEKTYFDFFHNHLNELDQLSLWKRIKILIRFFVYGRK